MTSKPGGILKIIAVLSGTLVFLFFVLVLAFEAYTIVAVRTEAGKPLPPTFGNFDRVRALLQSDPRRSEFSFAVLGDAHSYSPFERICEQLRDEPLSFLVLLGDIVARPTPGYHDFLRAELASEVALPFPVFYALGNHDVDPTTFPLRRFEETYGPTNFSFEYQGCLFIVLRVLPPPESTRESLSFLESVLSARRADCRKVFVFMHCPLMSSEPVTTPLPDAREFTALFDRFKVDYVISGHHHGHARVKVRDTVYLVSGGGGADLDPAGSGMFHHAVVITIRPDMVSEKILFVPGGDDLQDRIESLAIAKVYPLLEAYPSLAIIANAAILLVCSWMVWRFVKGRRKPRSSGPRPCDATIAGC